MMRQVITVMISLFLLLPYADCKAGETADEITSLLQFVVQSECIFMRNGKEYDAFEARQHIEKKYTYYKEQITTTEDFIRLSASHSSLSGKPYKVICNGKRMNSSDWLYDELNKLRAK